MLLERRSSATSPSPTAPVVPVVAPIAPAAVVAVAPAPLTTEQPWQQTIWPGLEAGGEEGGQSASLLRLGEIHTLPV